jgi:exopolysaccharide biosynthesis protein
MARLFYLFLQKANQSVIINFLLKMELFMKIYDTMEIQTPQKSTSPKIHSNTEFHSKRRFFRTFMISFFSMLLVVILTCVFLIYGPISYFRDLWVTTAMQTLHHQWLATSFFDKNTIDEIMANNKMIEPKSDTDPSDVNVTSVNVKDNATTLPTSPSDGEHIIDGIGFTRIKTATYEGWVVRVFDPSRIYMGLSQGFGKAGEQVSHMVPRLGAYVGINAGGFIDVNGEGNGGEPDKILISSGKLMASGNGSSIHNIVGFDKQGRLLLTRCKQSDVESLTDPDRDAVEFSPFLIVNGEAAQMTGNRGYGIQPRTAIGQTKTGIVIFVEIDGRNPPIIGASVKDLQDIFIKYDAYNAANLDGGSSSVVVFNDKVINRPSSADGERFIPDAFLINHTK